MLPKRWLGIAAISVAFTLTALAGLLLAQMASGQVDANQMVLWSVGAFIIVAPLFGFGIYTYANSGTPAVQESTSDVEQQWRLLELVRQQGPFRLSDAATELQMDVDGVQDLLGELVTLQIFSGYIDWETETLYAEDMGQLRQRQICAICGEAIDLSSDPIVRCAHCSTEYFLP